MLTLPKSALRAALVAAADKDIRYYLNGVLLECTSDDLHIVGTDGHRCFAGVIYGRNLQWTGTPQRGPWQMIIPRAAVIAAVKGVRDPDVTLAALPDGKYTLGDTVFTPIDGRFPDWRRILPRVFESDGTTPRPEVSAPFNYDYLADGQKALRHWFNSDKLSPCLRMYGKDPAVMTGHDATAQYVVMCMNDKGIKRVTPFTPAAYTETKAA